MPLPARFLSKVPNLLASDPSKNYFCLLLHKRQHLCRKRVNVLLRIKYGRRVISGKHMKEILSFINYYYGIPNKKNSADRPYLFTRRKTRANQHLVYPSLSNSNFLYGVQTVASCSDLGDKAFVSATGCITNIIRMAKIILFFLAHLSSKLFLLLCCCYGVLYRLVHSAFAIKLS